MTVVAECIACGTRLTTRSNAGRIEVTRACICPFQPHRKTWAALPTNGSDKTRVELVRAWHEDA
jgi:hypothetical protein